MGDTEGQIGLERGKDGLGGYGSSEQQSICQNRSFCLAQAD